MTLLIELVGVAVYVAAIFVAWFAQVVGLPGNWVIVAAAALYAWLGGADAAVGWHAVIVLLVLAVIGEIVEFVAAAAGVTRIGGSRRGAMLAIVGSLVGGIVGLFVGLPIPVIGSLVTAIVLGGVGALAGAIIGETWKGRDFDTSLQIGKAAFVGRVVGTLAKAIVSTIMVVVALGALVV